VPRSLATRTAFLRRYSDHVTAEHIRLVASQAGQGLDSHDQHLLQLLGGASPKTMVKMNVITHIYPKRCYV
jgi:hypothetical protein